MRIKYKNTIYEAIYSITDNNIGLKDNNFWIKIHFILKNDEIDYEKSFLGMTFDELKYWNNKNKEFLDGTMNGDEEVKFIKRIGEILYYPEENKIEKRLYIFKDVNKFYTIYFTREELEEIYKLNNKFISSLEFKY